MACALPVNDVLHTYVHLPRIVYRCLLKFKPRLDTGWSPKDPQLQNFFALVAPHELAASLLTAHCRRTGEFELLKAFYYFVRPPPAPSPLPSFFDLPSRCVVHCPMLLSPFWFCRFATIGARPRVPGFCCYLTMVRARCLVVMTCCSFVRNRAAEGSGHEADNCSKALTTLKAPCIGG